jgi:hypothetical protein
MTILKWLAYLLSALAVCTFVGTFVLGFTVDIQAPGTSVTCGAPMKVVDGDFASGVPDRLGAACQDAANNWIGRSALLFFLFFVPAFVLTVFARRRGEAWAGANVLQRRKA